MSVYKSKRTESIHQFREEWIKTSEMIHEEFLRVGNRKRKYYEIKLNNLLYEISTDVAVIDSMIMSGAAKRKSSDAYLKAICCTVSKVKILCDYLTIVFVLNNRSSDKVESKLSQLLFMMKGMAKMNDENFVELDDTTLDLYDKSKIRGVVYLEKFKELVDLTFTKCMKINNKYMYSQKYPLLSLISEAFSLAYRANSLRCDDDKSRIIRIEYLKRVDVLLGEYERIMWIAFTNPFCSKDDRYKISSLFNEVVKLTKTFTKKCKENKDIGK